MNRGWGGLGFDFIQISPRYYKQTSSWNVARGFKFVVQQETPYHRTKETTLRCDNYYNAKPVLKGEITMARVDIQHLISSPSRRYFFGINYTVFLRAFIVTQ